jgi:hypothetical protein
LVLAVSRLKIAIVHPRESITHFIIFDQESIAAQWFEVFDTTVLAWLKNWKTLHTASSESCISIPHTSSLSEITCSYPSDGFLLTPGVIFSVPIALPTTVLDNIVMVRL